MRSRGRYLALAPGLLLFAAILYPFLTGVFWAFSKVGADGQATFVGLANFQNLFLSGGPGLKGLWATVVYAAVAVSVQIGLGTVVALALTHGARWTKWFRPLIVTPLLLPPVVATIMWKVMMVDRGVLNSFVEAVTGYRVNWLGSPTSAFWSVVMIESWIYTPFVILILLAGLQSIPEEVLEAARTDGANRLQIVRHITLPLLRPFIILVLVFRGIDELKSFEVIWSATQGGPIDTLRTLHVYGYQYAIQYLKFGDSLTFLLVLWVLCYGLAWFLLRLRRASALG